MIRTFIQTKVFSNKWDNLGLKDEDLRMLEWEIMKNPQIGDVIPGTGRLRKMRFQRFNKGKRGSLRICYVDFANIKTVYLFLVYSKNDKDTLTAKECRLIKEMIEQLEKELYKEGRYEQFLQ